MSASNVKLFLDLGAKQKRRRIKKTIIDNVAKFLKKSVSRRELILHQGSRNNVIQNSSDFSDSNIPPTTEDNSSSDYTFQNNDQNLIENSSTENSGLNNEVNLPCHQNFLNSGGNNEVTLENFNDSDDDDDDPDYENSIFSEFTDVDGDNFNDFQYQKNTKISANFY